MLPSDKSPHTRIEDQLLEHVPCLIEDMAFVFYQPAEEIVAIDGTLLRIHRTSKAFLQILQLSELNLHMYRPLYHNGAVVGRWPR